MTQRPNSVLAGKGCGPGFGDGSLQPARRTPASNTPRHDIAPPLSARLRAVEDDTNPLAEGKPQTRIGLDRGVKCSDTHIEPSGLRVDAKDRAALAPFLHGKTEILVEHANCSF